jgi:hypothetical protein
MDVRAGGAADREAERVVDAPTHDLVVAREAGEDGQAGGEGCRSALATSR